MPDMIVGMDISATKLAWVVRAHDDTALVAYGSWASKHKFAPQHTLREMRDVLADAFAPVDLENATVWIEAPIVGRGGYGTTLKQSIVTGMVVTFMDEMSHGTAHIGLVPPQTWRKGVHGNGRAKKPETRAQLETMWPEAWEMIEVHDDDDLSDASSVCLYALQRSDVTAALRKELAR